MALARHNKKSPSDTARASRLRPGLPFYVGSLTDKFLPTFAATIRDGPEAEAPLKVSVLVASSPQPLTRARGFSFRQGAAERLNSTAIQRHRL